MPATTRAVRSVFAWAKVAGFRKAAAERFAKRHFDPDAIVLSHGLACFRGFASARFKHQPVRTGDGHRSMEVPEFQSLNTVLGNVKNAMQGTYHKASGKHLPRYLGEFCYRFSHRIDLAAMLTRLGWAAVRTPTMTGRLLGLAELS